MNKKVKQLTTASVFIALGVALSGFSIPIGASRCFPVQHFVNVLAGMVLGPVPAVLCAFCTSLLRLILGTGTLLAFPGSMLGACLCGIVYKYSKKIWAACIGEVVGTGLLGALAAYPVAAFILGRQAALFAFVVPFSVSAAVGAAAGSVLLYALKKLHVLDKVLA